MIKSKGLRQFEQTKGIGKVGFVVGFAGVFEVSI